MIRKTHKTAVVFIPPEECWPPIQKIRQQYDRSFRRWMPHITMIYPFLPKSDFDKIAPRLRESVAGNSAFPICMQKFRFFKHRQDNYTLWMAPEPDDPIIRLQAKMAGAVPECDDVQNFRGGFTPHLSVGNVKGKENMMALRNALQSDWQPLSFTLEQVYLIWRNDPPDDIFRIGKAVQLGTKAYDNA